MKWELSKRTVFNAVNEPVKYFLIDLNSACALPGLPIDSSAAFAAWHYMVKWGLRDNEFLLITNLLQIRERLDVDVKNMNI